ncbi:MAG: L,D-transpeptidase family protein [Eubacteriales bacterium]|nr:L,D-transpeptidase family protein [Eubacteriales bacterium]
MRRSRRKRLNKKKAEQKRVMRKTVLIIIGAVLGLLAANLIYIKAMDGRFYHHTSLNGYHISGKTVEEVAEMLTGSYNSLTLEITEQGETVLSAGFSDIGYKVDDESLHTALTELLERQSSAALVSLIFGSSYGVRVPFVIDRDVFQKAVCSEALSKPRIATVDASVEEENGEYVIRPEVYGTEFDNADLQSLVQETIEKDLSDGTVESVVRVEIPESIYRKPDITQDSPVLSDIKTLYTQYHNAQITYLFGEETVTLGWDTIREWLLPDRLDQPIDEEAVYSYVTQLASTYDTYGMPVTFESTNRGTMTIEYNNYGYQIDVDGEFSQLMEDIASNTAVEREPVYSQRGYSRNGMDDLNGTYVEVDLSAQYLWFYKDGSLVVESPIISGLPTEDRATHTGVFTIPYKASPFNLVGQGGGPGESWDVEVEYWMPFDDGQGLHDATWQSAFGGNTYMYAGSHGCINLPLDVAAVIYNYMEENVAILIYQ